MLSQLPEKLCFVDIETTGTSVARGKIIELGILRVEKEKVVAKYQTLLNPGIHLDPFITKLTGITKGDLENAPTFGQVKKDVLELLTDAVFVAHNVRFDYGFLRNEFKREEISFAAKHFCTVKLARYLYPGYTNYDLDSIIERFNLTCKRRHRAYDDAKVLWDFYKKAKKTLSSETFSKGLALALKRPTVPLKITLDRLESLPEGPGVYIFYGEEGTPIYIGKSVNIRDRVLSHFSNDYISGVDMKISQQICDIETIPTAGELGALLLESTLIKKRLPLFNRKLRHSYKLVALKKIMEQGKYHLIDTGILGTVNVSFLDQVIGVFKSERQAKDFLYQLAKDYSLCPKLLGLEKTKSACFFYHLGVCRGACIEKENFLKYNLRFDEAFYKHKIKPWPFNGPILIKEGNEKEEGFVIDKWCVLGTIKQQHELYEFEHQYAFDHDTYKILTRYLNSPSAKFAVLPQKI